MEYVIEKAKADVRRLEDKAEALLEKKGPDAPGLQDLYERIDDMDPNTFEVRAGKLLRGLGSDNIDSRLRAADFHHDGHVRWLGTSVASLSQLQSAWVIGSDVRKDQPLLALRLRHAARHGAQLHALTDTTPDWAMPLAQMQVLPASNWLQAMADVAAVVAQHTGIVSPLAGNAQSPFAIAIASSLLSGERKRESMLSLPKPRSNLPAKYNSSKVLCGLAKQAMAEAPWSALMAFKPLATYSKATCQSTVCHSPPCLIMGCVRRSGPLSAS